MNLRTYRAYTMAEALAAVKRDLGVDAAVLHTRTFRRGGFLGFGRRTVVEVTAAAAEETRRRPVEPGKNPQRRHQAPSVQATKAYAGAAATREVPSAGSKNLDARRLDLLAAIEQHRQATTRASVAVESKPASPAPASPEAREPRHEPPARVAQRFILTPASPSGAPAAAPAGSREGLSIAPSPAIPLPVVAEPAAVQQEMHAIRDMVSQILQHQAVGASRPVQPMPRHLFDMYLRLIGQDLSEELAEGIIRRVQQELPGEEAEDPGRVREEVRRHLVELVPVANGSAPTAPRDGRPFTIALIGPTGVGKTTTLAKLAANFKLRHGQRVGLVTSDTYRIAAVDQLRTYATIIGLPLKVVLTPEEMQQACHQLRDCEVILIDTAGRSQKDREKLDELNRFIAAAEPHEVHLVLSSTASEKVLMQEAESFSQVRADRVILTKLDEAVSFGVLVNVIRRIGKQLSFVTTGQEVPDHIEAGRPDRLAALVLGGELRA